MLSGSTHSAFKSSTMIRHCLAFAAALLGLGAFPAHATGTLSCDGELSFIDDGTTTVTCSGDLQLDGGYLLSADDALWLRSETRIAVLEATLTAPTLWLEAPQIEILGHLVATGGAITLLAQGGDGSVAQTLSIGAGAILSVAGAGVEPWIRDATYVGPGGVFELRPGAGALEPLTGGTITVANPVPEPAPWALLLGGLGLVGMVGHHRGRSGARGPYPTA